MRWTWVFVKVDGVGVGVKLLCTVNWPGLDSRMNKRKTFVEETRLHVGFSLRSVYRAAGLPCQLLEAPVNTRCGTSLSLRLG